MPFARKIDNHLHVWDDEAEDWVIAPIRFTVDDCVWDLKLATFDFCTGIFEFKLGPFGLGNPPSEDEEDE